MTSFFFNIHDYHVGPVGFKTQVTTLFLKEFDGKQTKLLFSVFTKVPMQVRKLVNKCAMRLPKQATPCPLRQAKFLGRAQFRHSTTYKTVQLSKSKKVI